MSLRGTKATSTCEETTDLLQPTFHSYPMWQVISGSWESVIT